MINEQRSRIWGTSPALKYYTVYINNNNNLAYHSIATGKGRPSRRRDVTYIPTMAPCIKFKQSDCGHAVLANIRLDKKMGTADIY